MADAKPSRPSERKPVKVGDYVLQKGEEVKTIRIDGVKRKVIEKKIGDVIQHKFVE